VFLVLLFNIRSPAHLPHFYKYPRSCSLTALFLISALMVIYRTSF
jgi:hypothetical protein